MTPNYSEPTLQEQYDRYKNRTTRFNKIGILGVLLLLIPAVFIFDGISYYDFQERCFLEVKNDVVTGEKSQIISGIKQLKKSDYSEYKKLCSKVSIIYERNCIVPILDSFKYKISERNGCYFKGSGVLFISTGSKSQDTNQIAQIIKENIDKIE